MISEKSFENTTDHTMSGPKVLTLGTKARPPVILFQTYYADLALSRENSNAEKGERKERRTTRSKDTETIGA